MPHPPVNPRTALGVHLERGCNSHVPKPVTTRQITWIFHTLSQPEETGALWLYFAFETKDTERVSDLLMTTQSVGEESRFKSSQWDSEKPACCPSPSPLPQRTGQELLELGKELWPPCLSTPPLPFL